MSAPREPIQPLSCPHCGKMNDQHTSMSKDARPPSVGDVAVCLACAAPAVFDRGSDNELYQRPPTSEEIERIKASPQLQRALAAVALYPLWQALHRRRN